MTAFTLYETLKEAYETTTQNNNRFLSAISLVKWDDMFYADGEYYFLKGDLTITVEDTNPFKEQWKPTAFFKDGCVLSF